MIMKTAKSTRLGRENRCQSLVTVTVTRRQKRKKHCDLENIFFKFHLQEYCILKLLMLVYTGTLGCLFS